MKYTALLHLLPLALLAACKPPAADGYVERTGREPAGPFASVPLPSPDTTEAIWAPSEKPRRIIYGLPGKAPLVAMACLGEPGAERLQVTRYAPADVGAQAFAPLVGNSHIARIPVDAVPNGRAHIWQGDIAADTPALEALTGAGPVELTVPGAGTVVLNPSPLPGQLLAECRPPQSPIPPVPPASQP